MFFTHAAKGIGPSSRGGEGQFLVQSFKATLQYCDEWGKFTSVSDSVSHSVNFPGGAMIRTYFVACFKMFAVNVLQNFETVLINTTTTCCPSL